MLLLADSCGGQLRGSDLITALKRAGFLGLIISVSGSPVV